MHVVCDFIVLCMISAALSMAPEGSSNTTDKETTIEVKEDKEDKDKDSEGADWDGEQMVPVPVDESLLAQLTAMDFPDVRARKGLVHGKTLEGALTWLEENQSNPNLDQPYMVKKKDTIPKKPLSAEEKVHTALLCAVLCCAVLCMPCQFVSYHACWTCVPHTLALYPPLLCFCDLLCTGLT
jgi:hypothetical protein